MLYLFYKVYDNVHAFITHLFSTRPITHKDFYRPMYSYLNWLKNLWWCVMNMMLILFELTYDFVTKLIESHLTKG